MIIVLFHALYLFGKFVYQNYRANKQKAISDDTINKEKQFNISERDYKMRDAEAPQDFEEHTIRFFPPAYVQRYVAVSDVLNNTEYQGKLRKIVDFGCAELDFLVYLKNTAGVEEILCVDIDRSVLDAYKNKAAPLVSEYLHTRTASLLVEIYEGSVIHNDKKLENTDAVICIELIEHLYPDTLTDLPYNIFGYIKPKLVVITTPNADFNVLFPNFCGFRHHDHKFEWTRQQFQDWAENITLRYSDYTVTFDGICKGPEGTEHLGCCTQMAVFHRIYEKDFCNTGIEGLFKIVDQYEYPFRVDNRSDEEKILDEATYYIRHLSYQNSDMEEEVPLKKLLDMLKSFHVSIEVLQTILVEANWTIENREFGPVVLVPAHSTFSDYSTVENALWNDYSGTDEDDWNGEPGPPINSSRFLKQDSLDVQDNQNWDQEPSIVIPQNNSILEDNTYLFDEENVLLDDVSETTKDTEIFERHTDVNSVENLDPIPSIDDISDSFHDIVPSYSNESTELSDSSFGRKCEGMKQDSFLDTTLSIQNDDVSSSAQKLNRTLDLPTYISVSRASTSPQPYLLQTVKMDQYLQNDSMCDQSMSNHWMLNSSIEQENISINSTVDITDGKCKSSLKNDSDNCDHLQSIYLNTSYKETEDSDIGDLSSNTSASSNCFKQSIQCGSKDWKNDSQLQDQLQSNSSISFASSALIENQPQFTSSPKVETKVSTIGKKRRSLDYKEQKNSSNSSDTTQECELTSPSNKSLESSNEASLQSNNDINVSTVLAVNVSTIKKQYNKQDNSACQGDMEIKSGNELINNSNEDTLTRSDTSTIDSVLNNDIQTVEELPETSYLSSDKSVKKNEMLQINLTAINKDKCFNSCTAEKSAREQTELAESNTNSIQSVICDTKIRSPDQLIIKSESHVGHINDNSDGKTELKSELRNVHDLGSIKNVNSSETSRNHAKEISNLESISLVSSLHIEDVRDVKSASVLKSEKRYQCNAENHESKCKSINPNIVEAVENIELKASSPEAVETPPNSWSPEVMDSGYPNSASAQDMTPEYDLSSIAQDHIPDSESPSIAEVPRLGILEVIEVENGDLVNNNRDGEGNNMIAAELNDLEDLQPLIDVLENDLENENDIYVLENGFPIWLLRILNMANPIDVEIHMRDHRELRFPNGAAGDDARYVVMERDEGFNSSSEENSDLENNEMRDNVDDINENALIDNVENDNENASNSDSGSEQWAAGDT